MENELEKFAHENNIPIMMDDGIEALCNIVKERGCKSILELGTAIGYSAIKMASLDDEITITTLEIDEGRHTLALENIANAHLSDRIEAILCDAMVYTTDKTFDLIFIDAAKSQSQRYLDHFIGNLNDGGIVVVDNMNFHGMVDDPTLTMNRNTRQMVGKIRRFRDEIQKNDAYIVEFRKEIGDGIMLIQKKSM